ncbi:MAG: carboxypeptidase regulatory-like domain-containing protein [Chitinophagaceae bacterium]|nr:carboxypeptidase regulatory-like domain-containing protein [Chitinophagaceae bacterium]
MRITILSIAVLISHFSIAQEGFRGIVVDGISLEPIEFANVTDGTKWTQTNTEGRFHFISGKDSILIEKLGYKKKILYKYNEDTVKLTREVIELSEIIISSTSTLLQNAYKSIPENYPLFPFKEKFFLRSLLKKNGEINKLEDIYGIVERKTLFQTSNVKKPKDNYSVELFNLRKAGVIEKNVDFQLYSFTKLFDNISSFYLSPELFSFKEEAYDNNDYTKVSFASKNEEEYPTSGYLIINNKDHAILEVLVKYASTKNVKRKGKIKYKTTSYEINTFFTKRQGQSKYTIDRSKLTAQVEVNEDTEDVVIYNCTYILNTFENFTEQPIQTKASISNDIFTLTGDYNPAFWTNQQSLPLTKEMQIFIDETEKDKKKFISNF